MLRRFEHPVDFLTHVERYRLQERTRVEEAVRAILDAVRARGDAALYELTLRFDGVDLRPDRGSAPAGLEVSTAERDEGAAAVPPDLLEALERAARNIEDFHRPQVPRSWLETRPDGSVLGQLVRPVDRVGIYVPGGSAPLYSCLLMTAIPARVAGVREVYLATPPGPDGRLHPAMLAAARLCGVDRIFRIGGAQAIAALAYGTETVPRVDLVVGPGNPYVTAAKRLVFGEVGIDMLAGPTELLVIDDGSVPAAWLAADLLSQAEHPGGTVILVTLDPARVDAVGAEIARQAAGLPRRETIAASLERGSCAIAVPDLEVAADLASTIAPEHLELAVADPWALLPAIRHAGSIFLGPYTPEPVGDYIAGPSNVIPTGGAPRYTSPVNVETFIKRSAITAYSERAFRENAPAAVRLAHGEGLPAHAASLEVRLEALAKGEVNGRGRP
ncbi:histidinol dehydrogenase [Caldinitratiruptor microaerophilus]|uniref:Histidinol dehydrogenase n=1 Tax=Caldinitratiruptor microaerophilus TaxID=671077 RepID=A0AA35CPD7_9FIRM|nr:histidinol dehydrogenase [Caldinitratiruptor microaerophilus]BDG61270.1 histidinol dehydrogenase [Caldinitratiruptor microaerophilus]